MVCLLSCPGNMNLEDIMIDLQKYFGRRCRPLFGVCIIGWETMGRLDRPHFRPLSCLQSKVSLYLVLLLPWHDIDIYIELFTASDTDIVSHIISLLFDGDTDTNPLVLRILSIVMEQGLCIHEIFPVLHDICSSRVCNHQCQKINHLRRPETIIRSWLACPSCGASGSAWPVRARYGWWCMH